jgi:hypothetical protein
MNSWQEETIKFDVLELMAKMENHAYTYVLPFLIDVGLLPAEAKVKSLGDIKTSLDPNEIPAGYLAALAYEWDKDGPTSPVDFVNSLRPELRGSPEREAVQEALNGGDFTDA